MKKESECEFCELCREFYEGKKKECKGLEHCKDYNYFSGREMRSIRRPVVTMKGDLTMAQLSKALFSSTKEDWATPQDFFDKLNEEFHFDLDPCADAENAKCKEYFTKEENGLLKDWGGRRVFCNPPYGRTSTGEWIRKCYEEAKKPGTVVVALIPARTDTRFFHDYIYHKAEIRFIKGRLKFGDCKDAAPFPSMVVIFGKEKEHEETEHAGSRGTGKEEA